MPDAFSMNPALDGFDRGHFAGRDGVRVLGVEQLGVSVEGDNQLFVRDRIRGREQPGAADDDLFHDQAFNRIRAGARARSRCR
jgi:hypothetical protein